jgi:serine protease AprX
VAGVAAGGSSTYTGVAPNAPIVSVRTADSSGRSITSDIVAGIDWILANKARYGIRVVNISMVGDTETSFENDPLDKAVEKLWFNGIVVVVAAGNHGTGTGEVSMAYAPANDPFVITVGAVDQMETAGYSDDQIPPWSAYGHTDDGFAKPELVAPGRYMIGPVPLTSMLPVQFPDRVIAPGYMWMSGTSFASPIVAGAAAQVIARHPTWTPDQVKGALMLTTHALPQLGIAAGVGELDAADAAALTATPPNPNENLDHYLTTDPASGQVSFDTTRWDGAVQSGGFTTTTSWSSASWSSASWSSASWSSASWSSASWSSASWSSSTNTSASDFE